MNYRFQRFTTVYPEFIKQFLEENPNYRELSYAELYDRFTSTFYGTANFFSKHLKMMGNEAADVFASFEPLQKQWAREQGVTFTSANWNREIILAQIKAFRPDVLYLSDLYLFDPNFRREIRASISKDVLIVGWRAAPTSNFHAFQDLDVVLTCVPNLVNKLRDSGAAAVLLPHAFEPSILDSIKAPPGHQFPFTFAGAFFNSPGCHLQRYQLIEQLLARTPLEVWGEFIGFGLPQHKHQWAYNLFYKSVFNTNRVLQSVGVSEESRGRVPYLNYGATLAVDPTKHSSLAEMFPGRVHPPVFGRRYYDTLAGSAVVLNVHGDVAEDFAGNMRLFEATGAGACLLTDAKANLNVFFEPDVEVATYRTAEECIEKAMYLLAHAEERAKIAAAGQRRTLRDHTYAKRMAALDQIIQEALRT